MKKKGRLYSIVLILAFFTFGVLPAQAVTVELWDWAFNVDGDNYSYQYGFNDELSDVPDLDYSLFDDGEGLGTLTWTTEEDGDHTFIAFFDHELDEWENGYINEFGDPDGTLPAGQSWEIDDPWFGDIYYNIEDSTPTTGSLLDSSVFNGGFPLSMPNDISMAMGWDFILLADQKATISLLLSETMPTDGFYLSHTDPETGSNFDEEYSIYFSSTLEIKDTGGPGPGPIPEPSTLFLMGLGLAGLLGIQRKRSSRNNV